MFVFFEPLNKYSNYFIVWIRKLRSREIKVLHCPEVVAFSLKSEIEFIFEYSIVMSQNPNP